ncbi:hypothetical protein DFH07DRAFT_969979 [Mycena maculata]|uniref:Uncharacterized protein n=1 Tax=Mycena maculata TaxID=230809 RepID=A0AAD7HTI6_9AGAR|nr:hypothetical protein DFH07DRAFT_969979 [Mycena maculata]
MVLITGTSIGGIGLPRVSSPSTLVITGYSAERRVLVYPSIFLPLLAGRRLQRAKGEIEKELPLANIRTLALDLSSLVAVRTAAAEVNEYPEPIHVLINNAAAAIGPFKLTVDGLESQMAVNHVGHFLFTKLVLPKLLAAKTTTYTPRVVTVASAAHTFCDGVDLDAIAHPRADTYETGRAYYRTKCANILMTLELSRRASGAVRTYSLNPGAIYTNMMLREESREYMQSLGIVDASGTPIENKHVFKTIPQGAATTVVAAFDPRLEDKPGAYLSDSVEANAAVAPHSSDPVTAAKLWALTEKLVGEPFVFP